MRFPLTNELLEEARRYSLRSACPHCFYYVQAEERCAHEWPTGEQARWPLDAPLADGSPPRDVDLCKEFELR